MTTIGLTANPSGGLAFETENRLFIAKMILESRNAPSDQAVVQAFHKAMMGEKDPYFLGKCALFATHKAGNRDIAAAIIAFLYARAKSFEGIELALWHDVASTRLIDSILDLGQMRSFFSYLRGPKQKSGNRWGYTVNIGGCLQKDLKFWFNTHPLDRLIKGRAGNAPSTKDMIKMVHPKTKDLQRNGVYQWLVSGKVPAEPYSLIAEIELLKHGQVPSEESQVWNLPSDQLMPLMGSLTKAWMVFAQKAKIQKILKSINTFAKHGVYKDEEILKSHIEILKDPENITNAKINTYEVFRAIQNVDESCPTDLKEALDETFRNSIGNIEKVNDKIAVLIDTSGSMQMAVSHHNGKASALRRVDAAAIMASALQLSSSQTKLIPFDTDVRDPSPIIQAEGIPAKAEAIARYMGAGTNIARAFEWLGQQEELPDRVVLISDNESLPCFDTNSRNFQISGSPQTTTSQAWQNILSRKPQMKLLAIDICPNSTMAVNENHESVSSIAGWGPTTFQLINQWLTGEREETAGDGGTSQDQIDIVEMITNFSLATVSEQQ